MALIPAGFKQCLDGNWSTFKLSIGPLDKPDTWQSFQVLVSTSSHQLKVPFHSYCDDFNTPWGNECGRVRGVREPENGILNPGGFYPSKSETWNAQTQEDMCIDAYEASEIAEESVKKRALILEGDYSQGGRVLRVEQADIEKGEVLGSFGLSAIASTSSSWESWIPGSSRFLDSSVQNASFIQRLKTSTFEFLSLSYGYTAGAAYKNAQASLTIGYYSSSLLLPGARSFSLSKAHSLKVQLSRIQASGALHNNQISILEKSIPVLLDSTHPWLQFPEITCRKFQEAFGLQHENGLFLVNHSTRATLREMNPNVTLTFTGGVEDDGSTTSNMDIIMPYSSFDLEIKSGPQSISRTYFPLKIVPDDEVSILGRAFFQEAYLIVNYAYENFTLSQRSFAPTDTPRFLTPLHAEMSSSINVNFMLLFFAAMILFYIIAIPYIIVYCLPQLIVNTLFDKPRKLRIKRRQDELRIIWGKIHGE